MDPRLEQKLHINRRQFFGKCATGIGAAALASLINPDAFASDVDDPFLPRAPHFAQQA